MATARRTGRAEYDEHVQGVEAAEIDVGLREGDRPRDGAAGGIAAAIQRAAGHERDDRTADLASHRSHAVGHARQHRGQDCRRRPGHAAPARRSRAERHAAESTASPISRSSSRWISRSSASSSTASAIARYGLRVQDVADAIETSFAGTTVGRVFDRRPSFDLVVKLDSAAGRGLRADRRPADRYARRRHDSAANAGGRAPRSRSQHDPPRERPATHRRVLQCRGPRSRRRRQRHSRSGLGAGADAGGLSRRIRRTVREPAERLTTPADPRHRGDCGTLHGPRARLRAGTRCAARDAEPAAGADRRRRRRLCLAAAC